MKSALKIHVRGIVQGVGYRPFVYKQAKHYLITGWVLNSTDGVHIFAEGEDKFLDEFCLSLANDAPLASKVEQVEMQEVPLEGYKTFEIRHSQEKKTSKADKDMGTTLVSPDLATCKDCTQELFDPKDRRYRYPFINCTNCGPRFTIIKKLPYDRKLTSMEKFKMCSFCQDEYTDPLNRRFHAQPNACFDCGPYVSWVEVQSDPSNKRTVDKNNIQWGNSLEASNKIFARATELLKKGKIIAVKGLGGFHLVCDASNEKVVSILRKRKERSNKAFAVMTTNLSNAEKICYVNNTERKLLTGSRRPIVLLTKKSDNKNLNKIIAPSIINGLPEIGVMLPYTPVQHILLNDFEKAGGKFLVMTSGNIYDSPIVINDNVAYEKLSGVADAFLGNNREILTRYDDSVVRVIDAAGTEALQFIRRARGYSPTPIKLNFNKKPTKKYFAAGPEQKNTFCYLRPLADTNTDERFNAEAFVSQHIGDVEDAQTYDAWLEAKLRFEQVFKEHTENLVCDMHPEYLTIKWAHEEIKKHSNENFETDENPETNETFIANEKFKKSERFADNKNSIKLENSKNFTNKNSETDKSLSNNNPENISLIEVQHHFAHIASVMAENNLQGPVAGFSFDGTGYGMDKAIWGGEVLLCNTKDFERFANFTYVPMPGGVAAIKEPLKMAYGVLWVYDLLNHPVSKKIFQAFSDTDTQNLTTMIEKGINTPQTSSVGRLFDAASALLGICPNPTYEGESAIMLEAAVHNYLRKNSKNNNENFVRNNENFENNNNKIEEPNQNSARCYEIQFTKNIGSKNSTAHDTSVILMDAQKTFKALLDDIEKGVSPSEIAKNFHDAFVKAIVGCANIIKQIYGINEVALSGGVFMNRYLIENTIRGLIDNGFNVAINKEVPPNDGGISLGQASIAAAL